MNLTPDQIVAIIAVCATIGYGMGVLLAFCATRGR